MSQFQPGRARTGGRARGTRNRLSHSFLESLHADFLEHGEEVIKIVRFEKPHEYLKVVAGLMPRELDITTSHIEQISDEELDAFITYTRQMLASNIARRDEETIKALPPD
jgi:hypothetical protein